VIKKKNPKKRRRKSIDAQPNYGAHVYEKESILSLLLDSSLFQFILMFIIGWGYIIIWMNTSFYDHSFELMEQPNLEIAFVPPWIATFSFILFQHKNSDINELIGGNLLIHILSLLVFSLFIVLSCFALMLLGLIILAFFGVMLGIGN
jgi:hypothetical protein